MRAWNGLGSAAGGIRRAVAAAWKCRRLRCGSHGREGNELREVQLQISRAGVWAKGGVVLEPHWYVTDYPIA
jgi:hypothetical protein